ncbi:hypothetical protein J6590_034797 [Homalodisca vitripennis]|nr:hypothetical protein J6590_034797 [Homalodisca vitripennis]
MSQHRSTDRFEGKGQCQPSGRSWDRSPLAPGLRPSPAQRQRRVQSHDLTTSPEESHVSYRDQGSDVRPERGMQTGEYTRTPHVWIPPSRHPVHLGLHSPKASPLSLIHELYVTSRNFLFCDASIASEMFANRRETRYRPSHRGNQH